MQNEMVNQITMKAPPLLPRDVATKEYVDLAMWPDVDAACAVNVDGVYDPALMTITVSSPQLVADGITLEAGRRVLLVGQLDAGHNGIYEVASGAPNTVLVRAADAARPTQFFRGKRVVVSAGDLFAGKTFEQVSDRPDAPGDPVLFQELALERLLDAESYHVTLAAGQDEYVVAHTLATRNVQVSCYDDATDKQVVTGVVTPDEGSVVICLDADAASGAGITGLRVVITAGGASLEVVKEIIRKEISEGIYYSAQGGDYTIDIDQSSLTDESIVHQIPKVVEDVARFYGGGTYALTININPGADTTRKNLYVAGVHLRYGVLTINVNAGCDIGNFYVYCNSAVNINTNVYGTVSGEYRVYHNHTDVAMTATIREGGVVGSRTPYGVTSGYFYVCYNICGTDITQTLYAGSLNDDGSVNLPGAVCYGPAVLRYNIVDRAVAQNIQSCAAEAGRVTLYGSAQVLQNWAGASIAQNYANNDTSFDGYFTIDVAAKTSASSTNQITLTSAVPDAWRPIITSMIAHSTNAATGSNTSNHINANKITAISADGKTLTLTTAIAKPFPEHTIYIHMASGATKLYIGTSALNQALAAKRMGKVAVYGTGATASNTVTAVDPAGYITISPGLSANGVYNGTYQLVTMYPPRLCNALAYSFDVIAANKVRCLTDTGFYNHLATALVGCYIDGAGLPAGTKVTAAAYGGTNNAYIELTLSGSPGLSTASTGLPLVVRDVEGWGVLHMNNNQATDTITQSAGHYSLATGLNMYLIRANLNLTGNTVCQYIHTYCWSTLAEYASNIGATDMNTNQGTSAVLKQIYMQGEIGQSNQSYNITRGGYTYIGGVTVVRRYVVQCYNTGSYFYIYGASTLQANTFTVKGYVDQSYNSATCYIYRINIDSDAVFARIAAPAAALMVHRNHYWYPSDASVRVTTTGNYGVYAVQTNLELPVAASFTGGSIAGLYIVRCNLQITSLTSIAMKLKAYQSRIDICTNDSTWETKYALYNNSNAAGRDPTVILTPPGKVTVT